jgi:hypothetical protein
MALGQESVTSLRFAVSKHVKEQVFTEEELAAEERAAQEWKAEPVRATELERDQIRLMVAGIHDKAIRDAVVSAEIAHLEWRKGIEARKTAETALQSVRDANQDPQP